MVRCSCNCLNIILNVNQDESRKVKGSHILGIHEKDDDNLPHADDFFSSEVSDIKLSFAGIEVQQKLLIKERNVGDYKVTRCINCGIDTHAVHKIKGLERVLANEKLQSGDQIIENLKSSYSYSPVFKILLRDDSNSDLFSPGSSHSVPMFQKSKSDATTKVNEMVKKFILLEEEAMKERMRIYAEEQQQKFRDLQERVNADRDSFLRVIYDKEEHALRDSLTDAMRETTFKVGSFDSEPDDVASELPRFKGRKRLKKKSFESDETDATLGVHMNSAPSRVLAGRFNSPSKPVTNGKVKSPSRTVSNRRRTKSETDDTMFDLDGFHDNKNCEPFFESDEDSSGDSNSLEGSGGYFIPSRGSAGERVYATSVPVTVPYMARGLKQNSDDEPDEYESAPSPERMAESIKALARSIQDSRSIFGELPRPSYTETHRP